MISNSGLIFGLWSSGNRTKSPQSLRFARVPRKRHKEDSYEYPGGGFVNIKQRKKKREKKEKGSGNGPGQSWTI